MADISKININGTEYNMKDESARSIANSKLSDAPSNGNFYLRQNGTWTPITCGTNELTPGTSSLNGIYFQYE